MPGNPVRYVVLTHAHEDHIGGHRLWSREGAQVVAHRLCLQRDEQYRQLIQFRVDRAKILWGGAMDLSTESGQRNFQEAGWYRVEIGQVEQQLEAVQR